MNTARDGSLNRHGGQADMESNADAAARDRKEAVEEQMREILARADTRRVCPECEHFVFYQNIESHITTCELLRERAEREVAAAERGG